MTPSTQQDDGSDDGGPAPAADDGVMDTATAPPAGRRDPADDSHGGGPRADGGSFEEDDEASGKGGEEEEEEEEEEGGGEYVTAYSRLAAAGSHRPAVASSDRGKKQQRRRRGGYGNAASVLEALPSRRPEGAAEEGDATEGGDDDNAPPAIEGFAMDVDDFAEEGGRSKSMTNIFMEAQDDDDERNVSGSGSDSDSDEATAAEDAEEASDAEMGGEEEDRPGGRTKQTVSRRKGSEADNDSEASELEDEGGNGGEEREDDVETSESEESENERPRGRTKRVGIRKGSEVGKESGADRDPEAVEAAGENVVVEEGGDGTEDEGLPQSQASGYGFSQGTDFGGAPRETESEMTVENNEYGDGETSTEKSIGVVEEEVSQEEVSQEGAPVLEESPAEVLSSEVGTAPSETSSKPGEPPSEQSKESAAKPTEPSHVELLRLVDSLFRAADKDNMTVGGINKSVASHYGWAKVEKKTKKMIKSRLIDLMNGKVDPGADDGEGGDGADAAGAPDLAGEETSRKKKKNVKKKKKKKGKRSKRQMKAEEEEEEEPPEEDHESEEENGDDSSSDYEVSRPKKSGRKSKKTKKARKSKLSQENEDEGATDSDGSAPKKTKKRSPRSKSRKNKGKMAKHLRDRHEKARLRQLEEARIRQEELGHLVDDGVGGSDEESNKLVGHEVAGPRLSEQDKDRAKRIAERFDTNREELILKRREERAGLIQMLGQRRLESLAGGLALEEAGAKKEGVENEGHAKAEGVEEMGEVETEAEGKGKPKLSCTYNVAGGTAPETETPANAMVDLDEDEESGDGGSDDDSDEDLEIVPPGASDGPAPSGEEDAAKLVKKASAMDLLFRPGGRSAAVPRGKKMAVDSRAAIRNALRAKQIQVGNNWLAQELNYKGPTAGEDYIRDCKEKEREKRAEALLLEKVEREQLAKMVAETALREDAGAYYEPVDEVEEAGEVDDDNGDKEYDDEEDEMAMAHKMNLLGPTDANGEAGGAGDDSEEQADGANVGLAEEPQQPVAEKPEENTSTGDSDSNTTDGKPGDDNVASILSSPRKTFPGSVVTPSHDQSEATPNNKITEDENPEMTDHASTDPSANEEDAAEEDDSTKNMPNEGVKSSDTVPDDSNSSAQDPISETIMSEEATSPAEQAPEPSKPEKPKNSAWQAMLQKEKEALAKQKKLQKKGGNKLVDGEAEEEEEEEGIVGLEDFGFAVQPKKGDNEDDDDDAEVDQDDLDHVVDDVSDGEGDEEAGTNARKRLEQAEEKARHKEMIQRMKDGYDGRRGGIVGSAGARGTVRFDQLVAAEGREDAKRLGLLHDGELDSEDEEGGGLEDKKKDDDEEEDEAALLDKWMKERVLQKEDNLEENFTDDEESEDEADTAEKTNEEEDKEDREQDRLAKHFEKRARRNRILGEYEGDSQFSRSRLIDEDESTQQDLKAMRTSFFRKRSSSASLHGSNIDSKENNYASKKLKRLSSQGSDGAPQEATSSFLSHEGSLSVALMASRRTTGGRKRKTTFLSGRQKSGSSFSRQSSSSSSITLSLNHVVFMAGDSQSATSQLPDSSSSSLVSSAKSRRGYSKAATSKKLARRESSLWSKVCSKNFRAN